MVTPAVERVKAAPDPALVALVSDTLRADRARRDAEHGAQRREHLRVSEVGTFTGESACLRKLWYDFHGAPKDEPTDDTLLNFSLGDVIGLRIANILSAGGAVEKVELPLSFPGYPILGRLDVLMMPSLRRVVEIKSATRKQRAYLPKNDHVAQVNLYVHAIRHTAPEYEEYDGALLYAFKDAAKGHPVCMAFFVPYDAGGAVAVLETAKVAHAVATGDTLPSRPAGYTPTKWPCGYCMFQTHCWSRLDRPQDDGEVP